MRHDEIGNRLRVQSAPAGLAIRARHHAALISGIDALLRVESSLQDMASMGDLLAEDVRLALRSIETLVGRVGVEDILGEIFSSFCIGK